MELDSQKKQLSNQQRLLLKIQQATAKLNEIETAATEPIAIIGIGCRFPGGVDSPEAYWKFLQEARDVRTEIPKDRWDVDLYYDPDPNVPGKIYVRQGYFLQQPIDQFDPAFFGISGTEAAKMDASQRLLLEVTWEALENAGISPKSLKNTDTGVYIGQMNHDYGIIGASSLADQLPDFYLGIGTTPSMSAGRIAYILGLQGPALFLDTSCSSSLVTLHLACQSLRSRESNLALVGGVNLMLAPHTTHALCQGRALSPDSRCKAFDASADGFARGEGCGIVILKRLRDALADSDRILALVKGSAINHDGSSSGLTVPNQQAQKKVIRQALKNAKVDPLKIDYVECHGTGTSLGDPLEIRALDEIYCQNRSQEQILILGAVKSNIGHLEAAAGIASLIKVVLAFQHQEIPANLHFNQPNPQIDWEQMPVKVPTTAIPWNKGEKPRLAGISGFGMSGTNAHVILEEAPLLLNTQHSTLKSEDYSEPPYHLLTLSAKTEKALADLVSSYHNYLERHPELAIADICHTANTGRTHFNHRLAIIASNQQELTAKLSNYQSGKEVTGVFSGKLPNSNKTPKVVFLFSGNDLQSAQLGQQLYETQRTFRQTIDKCDQILRPYLENSLRELISGQQAIGNQEVASVCVLFTVQYALAQLWQSWGIKPEKLLGHGVGEYVAGCFAEIFSLEDGLKLIATRGKLMAKCPSDSDKVSEIEREWEKILQGITYNQPRLPLVSNITGQEVGKEMTSAQYWVNQLRTPVSFNPSRENPPCVPPRGEILDEQEEQLFLEIGGSCLVSHSLKKIIEHQNSSAEAEEWLPSLHSTQAEWQKILENLGQLYVKGVIPPVSPQGGNVDWSKFAQDYAGCKIALPTYPFQRQRYWIKTADKAQAKEDVLADSSPVFDLINQGDKEGLIQELNLGNELTVDEKKILTKLLESIISKQKKYRESAKQSLDILEQLKNSPEKERLPLMLNYLQGTVVKILGLETAHNLDIQLGFVDLGMNYSLMLELREVLEKSLGCSVSVTSFVDYFNIQKLAEYVIEEICGKSLEETKEVLRPTANKQQIKVDSKLELLGEEALATAMQNEEMAMAVLDELNEITLLLNNEGN